MKHNVKYRIFKVSVNIPFLHYYLSSKVYEIKNRRDLVPPVLLYSTATLLLGFWGLNIFKSLEALHINFSGGEDYSDKVFVHEYDETINFVWMNLSRETSQRLNRDNIKEMLGLQEKYMDLNDDAFSENNIFYLKNEMIRNGQKNITITDIIDFFDALQLLRESKK